MNAENQSKTCYRVKVLTETANLELEIKINAEENEKT